MPDYALNVWLGEGGESTGRGRYGRREEREKREWEERREGGRKNNTSYELIMKKM